MEKAHVIGLQAAREEIIPMIAQTFIPRPRKARAPEVLNHSGYADFQHGRLFYQEMIKKLLN